MTIQINNKLLKSRNPTEHKYAIENRKGIIIQSLDDGYNLIEFNDLYFRRLVRIERKKVLKLVKLQWYVHESDFKVIDNKLTLS